MPSFASSNLFDYILCFFIGLIKKQNRVPVPIFCTECQSLKVDMVPIVVGVNVTDNQNAANINNRGMAANFFQADFHRKKILNTKTRDQAKQSHKNHNSCDTIFLLYCCLSACAGANSGGMASKRKVPWNGESNPNQAGLQLADPYRVPI
jgi:hypothetical protein